MSTDDSTNGITDILTELESGHTIDEVLQEHSRRTEPTAAASTHETGTPIDPDATDDGEYCPTCERTFVNAAQHWASPRSDCTYPDPTRAEAEALIGLWLAGGYPTSLNNPSKTPRLQLHATTKPPLEWVNSQLGRWEGSVVTDNGQNGNVYHLNARKHPYIATIAQHTPREVNLTAQMARIVYAIRGRTRNGQIVLRVPDAAEMPTPDTLAALIQDCGFTCHADRHPNTPTRPGRVVLPKHSADEFAVWIGPIPPT